MLITEPFWAEGLTSLSSACLSSQADFFTSFVFHQCICPHSTNISVLEVCFCFQSWGRAGTPETSSLLQLHLIKAITSPRKSLFSFYHHGSNNSAVIAIVIYPVKQLTCVWINNCEIPEIFHPTSYKKREHTHPGVPSFRKGSICRTKYRNQTGGWAKWASAKRYIFFEKCTCYWTSFYLHVFCYAMCTVRTCHASSLLKFICSKNKTKSRSNRKALIAVPSTRLAGFQIYEFMQTGCIKVKEKTCNFFLIIKINSSVLNVLLGK